MENEKNIEINQESLENEETNIQEEGEREVQIE